jgi:hypothetical protein
MADSDKGIGHNKAPGTILVLWGLVNPYKGFIHNHSQVIAVRLLLGALKTCISPGSAYSFTAMFSKKRTAARTMLGKLVNAVSGVWGAVCICISAYR